MLYTLIQVNKKTGNRAVVYGHVTENVIQEFFAAYVDAAHYVVVEEYTAKENSNDSNYLD